MIYELVYTSAPSGLRPGSSGYCTVQSSRGIAAPTVDLLESLSGYRHVFTPGTPEASRNPVNFGHYVLRISGRTEHVLSRVSDCELDYSGRSNKLAHHVVVDSCDEIPAGPAWLLGYDGWMVDQWDGTVCYLETPREPPEETRPQSPCFAWQKATGDAGWGGVLAEAFLANPKRRAFVIYEPGTNVLALFDEAISLLPRDRRWDVTFATYGSALPATIDCAWTGLVAGSKDVQLSRRFVDALRINLTAPLELPTGGHLVEVARTGGSAPPPPQVAAPPAPAFDEPTREPEDAPVPLARQSCDEPIVLRPRRSRRPAPPPLAQRPVRPQNRFPWYLVGVAAACLVVGLVTTWLVVSQFGPQFDLVAAVTGEAVDDDVEEPSSPTGPSKPPESMEPTAANGRSAGGNHEPPPTTTASGKGEPPEEPADGDTSEEAGKAGTVVSAGTKPQESAAQESEAIPEMSKREPDPEPEPDPKPAVVEKPPVPEVVYALTPTDVNSDQPQMLKLPDGWDRGLGEIQEVRVLLPETEREGLWGAFQIQRGRKEDSKRIEFVISDQDDTFSDQDGTFKKYYPIARLLLNLRTAEVGYITRTQLPTPRQDSLLTNLTIKVKGASTSRVIALRPPRPLILARKETAKGIRFVPGLSDDAPQVSMALKDVRCHISPVSVEVSRSVVTLKPRAQLSKEETPLVRIEVEMTAALQELRIESAKCSMPEELSAFKIELVTDPSPETHMLQNRRAERIRLGLDEFWDAYKQIVSPETRRTLDIFDVDEQAEELAFESALKRFAEAFRRKRGMQVRSQDSEGAPPQGDPPILRDFLVGRKELRRFRLASQRWQEAVDSMQITSGRLFYRVYDPNEETDGDKPRRTWEIDFLRIGSDGDNEAAR